MNKEYAPRYIVSIFGVLAALLLLSWNLNVAHADAVQDGAQISIAGNGQVMVRNAQVVSVSGSEIVAMTGWGSTAITWTIETSGSTRFTPENGSRAALKLIKKGDLISFSGELDTSLSHPTVIATVVRDNSLVQESAVISGTVLSVDVARALIDISTQNGTSTIALNQGTTITRDGAPVGIEQINPGDTTKAFGTLAVATHTISALKITVQPGDAASAGSTKTVASGGIFSTIIRWLRSPGILTIK
ncbi:MAG: hypothetical protein JO019_02045 [Candidatus Kaiserbacteria bacterium]|nr:hypothetical protein [Candidatus Kaiserbacteria bacterium]